MNGYFARFTMCSGTTSVDFGSYSSMDIVCAASGAQKTSARMAEFIWLEKTMLTRGGRKRSGQPEQKFAPFVKRRSGDALILAVRANVVVIVGNARDSVRRNFGPAQVFAVGRARRDYRRHGNARPDGESGGLRCFDHIRPQGRRWTLHQFHVLDGRDVDLRIV